VSSVLGAADHAGATGATGVAGAAGAAGAAEAIGAADIAAPIVAPEGEVAGDELIDSLWVELLLDLSEPGRLKYQFVCSCDGVIAPG
jgi:hypothetical protein